MTVPTRPRRYVDAPAVSQLPYGLWSVVQPADTSDPHWRNGIHMQPDTCQPAASTVDQCPPPGEESLGQFEKPPTAEGIPTRTGDAFTVYSRVDCGPVGGIWQEADSRARAALTAGEARAVEHVFWTGQVTTPDDAVILPHLAADTTVVDEDAATGQVLQQPAAVTLRSGAVVDIVEAIGLLEQAMADCYPGVPTIHVPRRALAHLTSFGLVAARGEQLRTAGGSLVAAGAGYPGTGPDGATPAYPGAWLYATGAVKAIRGDITVSTREEAFDRAVNHLTLIPERTYALTWDCCLFAVHTYLGGRISSLGDSAAGV